MRSGLPANRSLVDDDRGTVTAEFAIVLPAVVVVLGLVIGGIALAAQRITLVTVAAEAARHEARGESAENRLAALGAGVTIVRTSDDGLHCIDLTASPAGGLLAAISISGRSCAALSDTGAMP